MKDSLYRLQDKTILLTGPFNSITQALLRTMTELGADVAFVNAEARLAGKYCDGVNEAREIHPDFGRAVHFALPLKEPGDVKEALGRLTESVGRVDCFVEASPLSWTADDDVARALTTSAMIAEQLLPFFKARQRGRIVYLFEDLSLSDLGVADFVSSYQEKLMAHIEEASRHLRGQAVTVNGISLGLTEDFVLRHYPKGGSIRKTLVELQATRPGLRLIEPHEVACVIGFLTCNASGSVSGQTIRLKS